MSSDHQTIISLCNLKEALAYFKFVIPFDIGLAGVQESLLTGKELPLPPVEFFKKIQSASAYEKVAFLLSRSHLTPEILPERLRSNEEFLHSFQMLLMAKFLADYVSYAQGDAERRAIFTFLRTRGSDFLALLEQHGLLETPVDIFSKYGPEEAGPATDVSVTISQLNLIDVENSSLQHILEFRKRSETMDRMRRFRRWVYKSYAGESKQEVEEDIKETIEAYQEEVKKFGLTTTRGSITTLQSAKGIAGTYLAMLLAQRVGHADWASAIAPAGVALTIAGIAVDVRLRHLELRKLIRDNPVSYILYARKHLAT